MDAAATTTDPARRAWIVLSTGVLAASFAAILIRYARDAHPLAISFWRCALGSLALAPFAARRVSARELRICLVAGAFLAAHFATWIWSLRLTSVAASVLLVSTTPVFVALAARYLFGERLAGQGWWGIVLALAGSGVIGLAGGTGGTSLTGDALAVAGAATAGGYALAGREAMRSMGIVTYAALAYGTAALLLAPAMLVAGAPFSGYDAGTWWAIAAIVAGPQLLGHTLINLSLKDLDATSVTVTIMAEPVIAAALAYVLFDESPSVWAYPGGIAIIAGIVLVSMARREPVVVVE